jgi:PAS domain S-box-containing protein
MGDLIRTLILTQELETALERRLATGLYRDRDDVIGAALRVLEEAERRSTSPRKESSPVADMPIVRANPAFRKADRLIAFRIGLNAALRDLDDPAATMTAVTRMLGETLELARAGYGEVDALHGTIRCIGDWTNGTVASFTGRLIRLDFLGAALADELRSGRLVLIEDGLTDPRGAGTAEAWAGLGIRSLVAAPVLKAGTLAALLFVHDAAPRHWSDEEVALVREVAERGWDAIGRARAEAALRESEARHRTLFEAAPFGVIILDPTTHEILDVNDFVCAAYGYAREELVGHSITQIDALGDSGAIRARGRAHKVRPGVQEFEARHRTRSGQIRDVLVRSQGISLGGRDVTYGAHIDITDRKAIEVALRASTARLRLAIEAARLSSWEFDIVAGTGMRDGPLTRALPGIPTEGFDFDTWLDAVHPEDRDEVERRFWEVAQGGAPRFEAEFRVRRPDGGWAWISSFGTVVERDPVTDRPLRIAGVAQDISDRRAAEERRSLLMREVDHRAKNVLAVLQAALRLTRAEDVEGYRRAIEGRVAAMARAQTLLAEDRWSGANLRALLVGEVEPFLGGDRNRVVLEGPPVMLPARAAQPLAMAVHELATNATKHGSLSLPAGRVSITWHLEGEKAGRLRLRWAETGGPALTKIPDRRGFGSRVLEGTVRGQLGGKVLLDWAAPGLVCEIEIPLARMVGMEGAA